MGSSRKIWSIIADVLTKSVREIRPTDIFIYLNLVNTKKNEMKGLI